MAAWGRRCLLAVATLLLMSPAAADLQPAVVYHVNVRLYSDADGDGVGDLAGVMENLGSLAKIGVDVVWLSPIFSSASEYHVGHKIANFTDIDPVFGDMDVFHRLVETASSLGIKVLLEVVPNHTSDTHEWFEQSVKRQEPYTNYYVWHKGVDKSGNNNDRESPNNWLSVTGGSAWTWNEERGQYYLHQFGDMQPDLNYWNKDVRQEMEEVLKFWLKRDVSGFVLSSVSHLYESKDLQDEPLHFAEDDSQYSHLVHNYTLDLPQTYQQVYRWRKLVDEFGSDDNFTRFLFVESNSNLQSILGYYGSEDESVSNIPLNFPFLSSLHLNNTAQEIETAITDWLLNMPTGSIANWMVGSNTLNDMVLHFSADQVDTLNAVLQLLPGIIVVYNGDLTAEAAWDETPDYSSQMAADEAYPSFNWDLSHPFSSAVTEPSTNETTLLEPDTTPAEGNKMDQESEDVHSRLLKKLSLRRSTPTLLLGDMQVSAVTPDVLLLVRILEGWDTFAAIINFGENSTAMNISMLLENVTSVTVQSASSNYGLKEGNEIYSSEVILPPYSSLVMKLSYALLDIEAMSTEDLQTELFTQDIDNETEATNYTTEMSSQIFDNSTEISTTEMSENFTEVSTEADNVTAETTTVTPDATAETSEAPDNSTETLLEIPDNSTELTQVVDESIESSTTEGGIENSTEISTAADDNYLLELHLSTDNVTFDDPCVECIIPVAPQQTEPNKESTPSKVGERYKSHMLFALLLTLLPAGLL